MGVTVRVGTHSALSCAFPARQIEAILSPLPFEIEPGWRHLEARNNKPAHATNTIQLLLGGFRWLNVRKYDRYGIGGRRLRVNTGRPEFRITKFNLEYSNSDTT